MSMINADENFEKLGLTLPPRTGSGRSLQALCDRWQIPVSFRSRACAE